LEEMISLIHKKEWYFLKIISLLAPKFKIKSMWLSFILPVYIWVCEMLYLTEEIPAKVSLNEAVEMAKVYWDESSKRIVNWVMNKFFKQFDEIKKDLEEFDWDFGFKLLKK
jgi:N utilization substance protein B